jgi:hypothetical protein
LDGLYEPGELERVNKAITALRTAIEQAEKQEPVGEVLNERGEIDYISYVPPVGTPLYTAPRQWVGLSVHEARNFYESILSRAELICKIDEFLEEKNT